MKQSTAGLALEASRYVLLGLLAVPVSFSARAASPAHTAAAIADHREETPQRAIWVRRKIDLVYLESGTRYSCYFLNDYVRRILLELGARQEGLQVHPVDCTGGPPSVAGSFYVLQAAPDGRASDPSSSTSTVAAHWTSVEVSYNDPFERVLDVTGKCQLVRTVFDRVLPLFAVRDAHLAPGCEMYQHLTSAAVLRAEILKPDAHE
jgi:hypothetical protein